MKEKVILAYSGGLDTSVSIKWLVDEGYDVIACCLDIGEGRDTEFIKKKHCKLVRLNLTPLMRVKSFRRTSY